MEQALQVLKDLRQKIAARLMEWETPRGATIDYGAARVAARDAARAAQRIIIKSYGNPFQEAAK